MIVSQGAEYLDHEFYLGNGQPSQRFVQNQHSSAASDATG